MAAMWTMTTTLSAESTSFCPRYIRQIATGSSIDHYHCKCERDSNERRDREVRSDYLGNYERLYCALVELDISNYRQYMHKGRNLMNSQFSE